MGVEVPLYCLVDWLPPDIGATGQYALIFATEHARAGRTVCLIGLATGGGGETTQAFDGGGRLTVVRLAARERRGQGYVARIFWSLARNLELVAVLARRMKPGPAEVRFTGSPPFMLYVVLWLRLFRKVTLTYRITDFYPEVVIAAAGRRSPLLALFERLTWALRRRIDRFEVLGEDQRRILLGNGVAPRKITLVRDISPVSFDRAVAPAARPAALEGRAALLYSGNFGVAHEVDTVVAGLTLHHRGGSDRLALWISGWGAAADGAAERLRAAGAPVARTPPVALADLAGLLLAADAHLITLKPAFAGYVVPSKVYGCIASGKPIVFVGPASSDVHLLCSRAPGLSYWRVEPGDGAAFAAALEALADNLGGAAVELGLDPEIGRLQPGP